MHVLFKILFVFNFVRNSHKGFNIYFPEKNAVIGKDNVLRYT